ncbi:hypothetical protein PC129_g9978 [Phytophthora cactorum]|uniref:Uncharacterized protein n=1 Tax=Phytophthora cactorum TaxID=29920 RepID=A0A8T1G5R4_9STRA|nr:hypothetical protein PC118_g9393 [Phytophthora cactorum]KAG3020469.1 hypothetical protein PC120_g9265 [Phytophthora cactorum]KAG3020753.1 hypothetical protein PC119_g9861 [Phytophthora cactorum]KAG3081310.1 hypothetical protein PC122_g11402 [Phytophthora cactorum]KAG3162510.1 hypothetical protein C6341_g13265 [Phytophthora cactorum]
MSVHRPSVVKQPFLLSFSYDRTIMEGHLEVLARRLFAPYCYSYRGCCEVWSGNGAKRGTKIPPKKDSE